MKLPRLCNIFKAGAACLAAVIACFASCTAAAADKITVFPESAFDAYQVYQNLAIFWFFIIGLIVIIRMKLTEIERTQEMGAHQDDEGAPRLE